MRQGLKLITSLRVNHVNLNYIVRELGQCADEYRDCVGCPDISPCVKAYDRRCELQNRQFKKRGEGDVFAVIVMEHSNDLAEYV